MVRYSAHFFHRRLTGQAVQKGRLDETWKQGPWEPLRILPTLGLWEPMSSGKNWNPVPWSYTHIPGPGLRSAEDGEEAGGPRGLDYCQVPSRQASTESMSLGHIALPSPCLALPSRSQAPRLCSPCWPGTQQGRGFWKQSSFSAKLACRKPLNLLGAWHRTSQWSLDRKIRVLAIIELSIWQR